MFYAALPYWNCNGDDSSIGFSLTYTINSEQQTRDLSQCGSGGDETPVEEDQTPVEEEDQAPAEGGETPAEGGEAPVDEGDSGSGSNVCPDGRPKYSSGLTQTQKDQILALHNDLRNLQAKGSSSFLGAKNMLRMEWDDEAEAKAQYHADQCNWGHDSYDFRKIGNTQFGQNLAL
mmetsp:Transcript_24086/g.21153  ORF Transcript_24086/g.21153 Transcript_24086/m.21153 type:complete len:175 (-) Transcript_24086:510-1034(-)